MVDVSFEKIMSSSVIYQELIDYNLWAERVFGAPFPRPNYALAAVSTLHKIWIATREINIPDDPSIFIRSV